MTRKRRHDLPVRDQQRTFIRVLIPDNRDIALGVIGQRNAIFIRIEIINKCVPADGQPKLICTCAAVQVVTNVRQRNIIATTTVDLIITSACKYRIVTTLGIDKIVAGAGLHKIICAAGKNLRIVWGLL